MAILTNLASVTIRGITSVSHGMASDKRPTLEYCPGQCHSQRPRDDTLGQTPLHKGPTGDSLSYTRSSAGVVTLYDVKNTGATSVKRNDSQSQINPIELPGGPNSEGGNLSGPGGSLYRVLPPAVRSEIDAASAVGSELIAREAESSALAATTNILDTAFQSYTSQLLLGNVSVTTQSSLAKVLNDQPTPTGDAFDEFIALNDAPTSDSQSTPVDVVASETRGRRRSSAKLARVGRVAGNLETSVRPKMLAMAIATNNRPTRPSMPQNRCSPILKVGWCFSELSAMQTRARSSLVNVVEAQRDFATPHIGVQASIGFYQAIDIGIEDLTGGAEQIPAPAPSLEAAPQAKPDNRYSKQQNAVPSGNAAAVIGASTWRATSCRVWAAARLRTSKPQKPMPKNACTPALPRKPA